jgi:hypothetical protein
MCCQTAMPERMQSVSRRDTRDAEVRPRSHRFRFRMVATLVVLTFYAHAWDAAVATPGTCDNVGGDTKCDSDVYVSFVMVGRVDTLRGDYVGRLRNSVQFIQALSEVHNVRSEVSLLCCKVVVGK